MGGGSSASRPSPRCSCCQPRPWPRAPKACPTAASSCCSLGSARPRCGSPSTGSRAPDAARARRSRTWRWPCSSHWAPSIGSARFRARSGSRRTSWAWRSLHLSRLLAGRGAAVRRRSGARAGVRHTHAAGIRLPALRLRGVARVAWSATAPRWRDAWHVAAPAARCCGCAVAQPRALRRPPGVRAPACWPSLAPAHRPLGPLSFHYLPRNLAVVLTSCPGRASPARPSRSTATAWPCGSPAPSAPPACGRTVSPGAVPARTPRATPRSRPVRCPGWTALLVAVRACSTRHGWIRSVPLLERLRALRLRMNRRGSAPAGCPVLGLRGGGGHQRLRAVSFPGAALGTVLLIDPREDAAPPD